jgi:hypothetical protein
VAAATLLAACVGEIGGTVTGLGVERSLTLLNNNTDALTVSIDGPFTFNDMLLPDSTYAVTVSVQPVGQLCEVTNGSGTLTAEAVSIDDILVTCSDTASLVGTLAGLVAGTAVTLGNGSLQLVVATNGPFAFPGTVSAGTAYDVAIVAQPAGGACSIANGTGTFRENVATNIAVTCN